MSHVLYEEGGKFVAARLMTQTESSAQVELNSGKRVKLKASQVLMQFDHTDPNSWVRDACELAAGMDVNLAWECVDDDEFGFIDLARDYFGANAGITEQAASLICLFQAPHYFRRLGKGRFKKASAEVVQQALAAIEKKTKLAAQIQDWATELTQGHCPAIVAEQLYRILFRPDKNSPEYKAVVQASRQSQVAPLQLLSRAGAISSPYAFHWQRFVHEHFPRGVAFADTPTPVIHDKLTRSSVEAFSIDDSDTTEIDDALSVQWTPGDFVVGIHIAVPALAIEPDSAVDQMARARYSTVYLPGKKITMLPSNVVDQFTLAEGDYRAALSLYVCFDDATLEVKSSTTRLEQVLITKNLRHDQIDQHVCVQWLSQAEPDKADPTIGEPDVLNRLQPALATLYRLALHLKAKREGVRGKPENFSRPDYTFRLDACQDDIVGDELVRISTRRRGAPLDLIVAECMILANSTWGQWLAGLGVPGIYRSQASLAPGVKVRMSTKPLPHAGIGVPSYAWSTSPLRRYVDLVNQWQLLACVRHGPAAALVAPFKVKDASLFAVISGFEAAYAAYNNIQSFMERYWTIKYLEQQGITELNASVINDNLVRADSLPLVLTASATGSLPKGSRVRVRITQVDLMTLDLQAVVVERIEEPPGAIADSSTDEMDDSGLPATLELALKLDEQSGDHAADAASGPLAP